MAMRDLEPNSTRSSFCFQAQFHKSTIIVKASLWGLIEKRKRQWQARQLIQIQIMLIHDNKSRAPCRVHSQATSVGDQDWCVLRWRKKSQSFKIPNHFPSIFSHRCNGHLLMATNVTFGASNSKCSKQEAFLCTNTFPVQTVCHPLCGQGKDFHHSALLNRKMFPSN